MQTQIELLKKYGLSVRGNSGQHFLIDPNMQRKIVALLGEPAEVPAIEIGPGLGALTTHLVERGWRVLAVEKDRKFAEILDREIVPASEGRLEVICADILECDLGKLLRERGVRGSRVQVAGNLPYYITAPILFHLIRYRGAIERAVLTVQKEVAARLTASPGTKDYGRLTLGVRAAADVRHAFDLSPGCFTPQPEVDSSTVVLDFHPPPVKSDAKTEAILFRLIQTAFGQRRKTLLHNLRHDQAFDISREELAGLFEKMGWAPTVRGEELLLKDYVALSGELADRYRETKKGKDVTS
ncbi:MAG: 16S rRNA (adenine(1518)-N(6)/adenine(1519)-N(6))-dimethyltransferase RsmA [Candidatus Omnitrophota bacterium]|jgi:16S rRNA (adenine1518-N6/adenine1519-N6)-dimethyltransferase